VKSRRAHAIVLPLRSAESRETFVVDALVLEDFLVALITAVARGETIEDGGAVLRFHPLAGMTVKSAAPLAARVLEGEQTNTSVLFGDRYVGKIVRKLDPGESAALDIGRFLTEIGYSHAPALAGWIDVRWNASARTGDVAPSTLGLVHALVPNEGDAWEHALRTLDAWLATASQRDRAPPKLPPGDLLARALAPLPIDVADAVGPYAGLAETLGRRVGEMHVALASRPQDAAFGPEPLDRPTREAIAGAARAELVRVLDRLGARGAELSDAARTSLAAVRKRAKSFVARPPEVTTFEDAGVKMRVHGDLHLGQVLFTGSDFVLIDFEGEPARSIEERKAKRSPLVDVAGMLRSFHYAAVSALRAQPESSRGALASWASLWQSAVSAAFVHGWLEAANGTVVVPREPAATRALLELFLLEKGVYEVAYEMNHRPDWVDIPLEGLREILGAEEREPNVRPEPARQRQQQPLEAGQVTRSMLDPRSPALLAFRQGKATHAHSQLGAHPHQDDATDFAVWAPHASRVAVIGDWNGWSTDASVLGRVGDTGIFAGRVHGAKPGQRYKYRIASGGTSFDKADPFAVTCEQSPGNGSVIGSLTYAWGDEEWMDRRVQLARIDQPISIYEVHLGSWRSPSEGPPDRARSYREIAAPLAAHVKEMGFTHVELMPLLEHPSAGTMGYDATGFFAPTSRHGAPADLMYLVDTLHRAGLGVILDWVPSHFSRAPHGLGSFDGGPLFERETSPVPGGFDFARPEVRSFLLSSAIFWIETFHADGLRLDGVGSDGAAFLRELAGTVKLEHPDVILAGEASARGLGVDLTWDRVFSGDLRGYLGLDPILRSHHQGVLTNRATRSGSECSVLALSHDDCTGRSLLDQMHGDRWQKLANLRLLYATSWGLPGKKLLFMGNETAAARMVGDLNRLYREVRALHAGDAAPNGLEWIDGSNAEMSVIVFARHGRGDEDIVVVACNFTPVPRHQYRIGVPRGGRWREIFNSDARDYGGSGHGNLGGVDAVPYPWNGRPSSVVVTLPPLGAIFLARGR
jgi:1,4-alpha-glucan branching enzyme